MLFALHAACECCLLCAAMGYASCRATITQYLLRVFPVIGYALFGTSVPHYIPCVICYKFSPL